MPSNAPRSATNQSGCRVRADVTEKKRSEETLRRTGEQLRQAQKMEAIGNLAGGVAHDFNNLLSVILSYSTMLASDMTPSDPRRADLEEILAAGRRAVDLTRQLLAFSRKQILQPRIVNLNDVVAGMERMLGRLIGADVELTVLPALALARVMVDPGQLTCGAIGLGEVEGLEYFHLLLLGQHRGVPPWLDWSLPDPIDAKEGRSSGGSPGEIHVRPRGDFVAVRGDTCCPSAGKFSGRLWGVSRGRRQLTELSRVFSDGQGVVERLRATARWR